MGLAAENIRPAAVAGTFYPNEAGELESSVRRYLSRAPAGAPAVPKAVIVPHAGFVYSGLTAAQVYARLAPAHAVITRVVILGPCHRVAVDGLALSGANGFSTPLGQVPVDRAAAAEVLTLPQVREFDATHEDEHCIEVQLPFLQVVLDDFAIVPLVVGGATPEQVAQVLDRLWGGPETLIVISSDLSHYLGYEAARRLDGDTRRAIENLAAGDIGDDQACGRIPIKGLIAAAAKRGMAVETLDVRNSGDTAGTKDRVVGYGAWVFTEPGAGGATAQPDSEPQAEDGAAGLFGAETRQLLKNHGGQLLHAAAASVLSGIARNRAARLDETTFPDPLRQNGACFVTLEHGGKLRGCIGSLAAARPLITDVVDNGFRAGFKDHRFEPVVRDEIADGGMEISISVLSPQTAIAFNGEDDLLAKLRPGKDGLLIQEGGRRAVFLPVVWESLPEPRKFLSQLKLKARFKEDYWSSNVRAWRFTTESVSSSQLPDPQALWHVNKGKRG